MDSECSCDRDGRIPQNPKISRRVPSFPTEVVENDTTYPKEEAAKRSTALISVYISIPDAPGVDSFLIPPSSDNCSIVIRMVVGIWFPETNHFGSRNPVFRRGMGEFLRRSLNFHDKRAYEHSEPVGILRTTLIAD